MEISKIIDSYIKELINKQNMTNTPCLKNLSSYQDYELIFKPVIKLIQENPYASLSTLRLKLLDLSPLKQVAANLINEKQITPGLVIAYQSGLFQDTLIGGSKQEYINQNRKLFIKKEEMTLDTIFDLASTSKIFTSLAILKLKDLKLLDLAKPINYYVKEFKNLDKVTVYDLLKFNVPIGTDERIDSQKSFKEAENLLFTVCKREKEVENAYTDMGCMVLKYVVERVSKMPFNLFVDEVILKPANMHNTYLFVPQEKIKYVANENYSLKILENGYAWQDFKNPPGICHDAKARLYTKNKQAPGNAGYFSNATDMLSLASNLKNNNIISKETLYSIANNVVGKPLNNSYSWFYGSLVYLKQPNLTRLGVPHFLSGKAFLIPGFAGTTFLVDPLNNISLFIGSNRLHNRIYSIHQNQKNNIKTNFLTGEKYFILKNGEIKTISIDFAKYRQMLVRLAAILSLQYQLLERIYKPTSVMSLVREL